MAETFTNLASTTLNGAINNSTTSVVVTDGSVFPSTGNFRIRIDNEILKVTSRSTNTLTVATRGLASTNDATTAASHADQARVAHVVTKQSFINGVMDHVGLGIVEGRLTVASGYPIYNPISLTPSSTDTSAETTTFSVAHNWVSGTMVTVNATGGGLTSGTIYWVNVASSTAVSYHTTLANALAGTSKVDLTASITALVMVLGVQNTSVYFAPNNRGNRIALYDGSVWETVAFSEVSVALGTVTADLPYDIFGYLSSGTLAIEKLAWTSATLRATALIAQDGVLSKTGDTTRRYLGTICPETTTAVGKLWDGGKWVSAAAKCRIWNFYNQNREGFSIRDITDSWSTSAATLQYMNADASNRLDLVTGVAEGAIDAKVITIAATTATTGFQGGFGWDVNNAFSNPQRSSYNNITATVITACTTWDRNNSDIGFHYLAALERAGAAGAITFYGDSGGTLTTGAQSGMQAGVWC